MRGDGALDIRLHRKNMEVPPALLDAAERKLAKLEPLLDSSGWVEVGFVEEQNPRIADKFHCEIVAHLKGKRLKVEGAAGEPFAALDRAAQRVDKQVRRIKDKRVRRGRRHTNQAPEDGEVELPEVPGLVDPEEVAAGDEGPAIAEVREAEAKPMTPTEAAMQLDVLGQEFLLFHNAETESAAVVYRRRDGDYGLVELPS